MDNIEVRSSGLIVADIGGSTRVVVDPDTLTVTGGTDGGDLGYPDVIIDQRRGYGVPDMNTQDDVASFWNTYVARAFDRPVVEGNGEVVPYINSSRWVADCPCGGGMLAWDKNPYSCCLDCGTKYSVAWQPPSLRSAIIRELASRHPQNRNWDPRRVDDNGDMIETVEFLRRENVLMGHV